MGEASVANLPPLIGRSGESDALSRMLERTAYGEGRVVLLSGEPGIGRTALAEWCEAVASSYGIRVIRAREGRERSHPLSGISAALRSVGVEEDLLGQRYTTFRELFAVTDYGLLMEKASSAHWESIDADIFAGMFSAVQDFVGNSLEASAGIGLGKLEYGNMKILIEHGRGFYLTAVFEGAEHPGMRHHLERAVEELSRRYGDVLENWDGSSASVSGMDAVLSKLVSRRYPVRAGMAGVNLEAEMLGASNRLLEVLRVLARDSPLLLVLEDIHWADDFTIHAVDYLARNISGEPLMVLATVRSEGGAVPERLEHLSAKAHLVALDGLSAGETEELVRSIYPGMTLSQEFSETLHRATGGNPFFVKEIMAQMERNGFVVNENGWRMLREEYDLPVSVNDAVMQRLESLDPEAFAVAEYASCMGMEFRREAILDYDVLADPRTGLSHLYEAGMVSFDGGRGRFLQSVTQEVLYESIAPRWKTLYHRSIGEWFERAFEDDPDAVVFDLARHFSRTREGKKAFFYCVRAGERAESLLAAHQALEFYRGALLAHEKHGVGDSNEVSDLRFRIGDILSTVGDFDGALDMFDTIISGSEDPVVRAKAHRRKAEVYHKKGDAGATLAECDKGLSLCPENNLERARLLGAKSWSYIITDEHDGAISLLAEALEIASGVGDTAETGVVLHRLGTACWAAGRYHDALEYLGKAEAIRREMGDEEALSMTLNNLAIAEYDLGHIQKALSLYKDALAIYEKRGDIHSQGLALSNIGLAYQDMGDYPLALEYYRRSLELKRRIDDRVGIVITLHNLGLLRKDSGEYGDALPLLEESLEMSRSLGAAQVTLHNDCALAEAHARLGNFREAMVYAEDAISLAEESGSPVEAGMARLSLGVVKGCMGEYRQAVGEFEEARRLFEGAEHRMGIATLDMELGKMLFASGDAVGARKTLRSAATLFGELGMGWWAEKCRALLDA